MPRSAAPPPRGPEDQPPPGSCEPGAQRGGCTSDQEQGHGDALGDRKGRGWGRVRFCCWESRGALLQEAEIGKKKTDKQRPLRSVVRHHRGAFYCKETKTTASALAGSDTSVCTAQVVARAGGQLGVQQEGGLREGGRAGLTDGLPAG